MKSRRIVIWIAVIVSMGLVAAAWTWMRERQGYVERKLIVDRQTAARELGFMSYLNEVRRIDSCPSSGIDLRFFSGECNRNDAILVSISKEGLSGLADLKASQYAGFEVGGKFRDTARIDLGESQARRLREEIVSKASAISPLGPNESAGHWKSAAFEACLDGRYHAAIRGDRDQAFDDLEGALMTTLGVKRMWNPEAPELLCM
jgi:hypothetical protein